MQRSNIILKFGIGVSSLALRPWTLVLLVGNRFTLSTSTPVLYALHPQDFRKRQKKSFCQRPAAHLDERSRPQTFSRAHRCLTALTLGFEFGTQCSWRRVPVLYLYNSRSLIASAFTVRVLRVSATFGCVGRAQVHNHETMQTSSSP